jgi:YgiT-type zinc finger domain-containing protein
MSDQSSFMCPRCQIGRCQPGQITYVRMYNGMLLTVPNMQVYTCDVCGYEEFEPEAIERLDSLAPETDFSPEEAWHVSKPSTADIIDVQDLNTTRRPKS